MKKVEDESDKVNYLRLPFTNYFFILSSLYLFCYAYLAMFISLYLFCYGYFILLCLFHFSR